MKKPFFIFLFLAVVTLPTIWSFLNTKFFYTQDYIFIARLQQMSTALLQNQFPVRWAPDLRYGEPLFNYYAPLPYYIGALIKLIGFNYIWVAKILFILASFLSAVTMYIFCRRLVSQKAAFLATTLYIYAPYRAVDIYVRGALSEAWAFVFFPLIFYTSFLLFEKQNFRRVSFLALSLAGLFLTHNVTALMFLPFLILWWLYLVIQKKNWQISLHLFLASVLGFGLAAFFLLPAAFEREFIQTKYLLVGYFNFRAHFVAFPQFFSTFWGYGSSLWGPKDGMSFQIGLAHWAILVFAFGLGLFLVKKNKLSIDRKFVGLLFFLGLSFMFSIFLQHNKSAFLWEAIPVMAFIQFPWRFLTISVFIVSIIGGIAAEYLNGKFKVVIILLIVATILINFGYFKPKEYVDDKFFDKFLQTDSLHKGIDLTKDYLPVWVIDTDQERFDAPRAKEGEVRIFDVKQISKTLNFSVKSFTYSKIEAPISFFPGWEVKANNQIIPNFTDSKNGLINFALPQGDYDIKIELKDTFIRMLGNTISLISCILLVIILFCRLYKPGNSKREK